MSEAHDQLKTECCGTPIASDQRFCAKCGWEARVVAHPDTADRVEAIQQRLGEEYLQCVVPKAAMKQDIRYLLTALDERTRQLPEGMRHCTIQIRKCKEGHGWLTATNWVQHECPTCERDTLRAERDAVTASAAEYVEGFDDWVWCTCSECKSDSHSHAIDISASVAKLAGDLRSGRHLEGE